MRPPAQKVWQHLHTNVDVPKKLRSGSVAKEPRNGHQLNLESDPRLEPTITKYNNKIHIATIPKRREHAILNNPRLDRFACLQFQQMFNSELKNGRTKEMMKMKVVAASKGSLRMWEATVNLENLRAS